MSNKTRRQSKADLAEVKRKLDTEVEGSPLRKGSGLQNPSPKRLKRLPIATIREIGRLLTSPDKQPNPVSLDAIHLVEPDKVHHENGMEQFNIR